MPYPILPIYLSFSSQYRGLYSLRANVLTDLIGIDGTSVVNPLDEALWHAQWISAAENIEGD
jgi:hypothetical protein